MAPVEKVTISMTADMAGYVREVVGAGQYASAGEAIHEAMLEWRERRELLGYSLEELRTLVGEGIDSGPTLDANEVFADLRQKVRARLPARP
ncbi:ribbon-helix-helix domain-containing protein [Aureimonas glaciei]|jgi:antitoxin ParD1/3/4|uniref:Transcriptional regulator n=1 Tax=Aureimonas glaciei TaxID=1776957 RepID=A0A917DH06_9HYPH|nr:type II toxin-antitoxin system ParD family antitoxin [Aureimonas glaciei]GGD39857.1 transcriptional regulator [Aureimonas glaciei]